MNREIELKARELMNSPIGRKLYAKGSANLKAKGFFPGDNHTAEERSSALIESFIQSAFELWLEAEAQEEKDFYEMIMLPEEFKAGVRRMAKRIEKADLENKTKETRSE